jgi:large subunit ribosomal protein L21
MVVERLPYSVGTQIDLDEVYLLADGDEILVGQPTVEGAVVRATILEEFRGPKIRIFKYKPKKRYRRRMGHRQNYMRLRVDDIVRSAEAPISSEEVDVVEESDTVEAADLVEETDTVVETDTTEETMKGVEEHGPEEN